VFSLVLKSQAKLLTLRFTDIFFKKWFNKVQQLSPELKKQTTL